MASAGELWAADVLMWQLFLAVVLGGIPGVAIAGGSHHLDPSTASRIYIAQCARCHRLHDPKDYAPEEWQQWTKKMCKKTKLAPAGQNALMLHLQALRAEPEAGSALSSRRKPSSSGRALALISPKASN